MQQVPDLLPVVTLDGKDIVCINKEDILYCTRSVNDILVHTAQKETYKLMSNLTHMEMYLGPEFERLEASRIIRVNAIVQYISKNRSVLLINNEILEIARPAIKKIKELLGIK